MSKSAKADFTKIFDLTEIGWPEDFSNDNEWCGKTLKNQNLVQRVPEMYQNMVRRDQ